MSDSPLSIAASITGLLTFVAAVVAGFYAHALGLRDAIDTQAEISTSLIRQPDRKYGTGDFKYFQGLYVQSLERMRVMDRELRASAELVTKGDGYGRISRVKRKAAWMASRARIQRDIDERKTESIRIFQIQLAMLSAKIDELSYHQNNHNATCNVMLSDARDLSSIGMMKMPPTPPSPTPSAPCPDRTKINNHTEISAAPSQYHTPSKASELATLISLP
ncbi:hypothetical protein DID88_009106 [Monilinia fructigena]|uniref:Uncharacterized protein n=1 Tax=Monilinia fructigena TaxID=38457 RepID=A0A395IF20_9HELO|nr:hypothetical protein DID88_009106 [Monilinia fructigena]